MKLPLVILCIACSIFTAAGAALNVDTNGNVRVPSNFPSLLLRPGSNVVVKSTNTGSGWALHLDVPAATGGDVYAASNNVFTGANSFGHVSIGTNLTLLTAIAAPTVTGTNNGIFWASNNTLWWTYTAGGTTTNTAKIAGP